MEEFQDMPEQFQKRACGTIMLKRGRTSMSQVLDTIITDDLKVVQRALDAGYIMPQKPYVDGGVTIYVLGKMKEKRPGDPMFKVDDEVPC